MANIFEIKDLHVEVEGREILKGVSITLPAGEAHALMGRNGSGKTTLAYTLMGHPKYKVTGGDILLGGKSLLGMTVDARAREGLFLAFQYPLEIGGVSLANFMRTASKAVQGKAFNASAFRKTMKEKMATLQMNETMATRYVNEGFSGGEKKRAEVLQMSVLNPRMAVLDEPDSGLDIDALRIVAEGVNALRDGQRGLLLITHYQRLLDHIQPDRIHVLIDGRIVRTGGKELAQELEAKGYEGMATQ